MFSRHFFVKLKQIPSGKAGKIRVQQSQFHRTPRNLKLEASAAVSAPAVEDVYDPIYNPQVIVIQSNSIRTYNTKKSSHKYLFPLGTTGHCEFRNGHELFNGKRSQSSFGILENIETRGRMDGHGSGGNFSGFSKSSGKFHE